MSHSASNRVPARISDGSPCDAAIAKVNAIVCDLLDCDRSEVKPEARLVEDLRMDDFDLIELFTIVEERLLDFKEITEAEAENLLTIADLHNLVLRRLGDAAEGEGRR